MEQITIIQPDDWHCHLRDREYLSRTVTDVAKRFGRAIVMPNLSPAIRQLGQAEAYRQRIIAEIPAGQQFIPLMTLYITENMTVTDLKEAKASGIIYGCKLYPAGATTHSNAGIAHLSRIYPLIAAMQELDLPLLIHGESIDPAVDIFERENHFVDQELVALIKNFPNLRIVLEHISTKNAVDFVRAGPETLAATITAHHLWYNRNALFTGGLHPHYYCMPILKTKVDQQALIEAAISGHSKFFLGTDSAPHPQSQKESACGCAGIYSAHAAIELYTQVFAEHGALDKLEKFASINGPNFYRLPINKQRITLKKISWQVPSTLPFGNTLVIPMQAGEKLNWQLIP